MSRSFLIAACLWVFAPNALAGITPARAAFERKMGEGFMGSALVDADVAPDNDNCEKASGTGTFCFALPYAQDMRLMFVTAKFDSGLFLEGTCHVLGLDAKTITREEFLQFRTERPMAAVRMDDRRTDSVSVLHPPLVRKGGVIVTNDLNLDADPVSAKLGLLAGSIARLGVSTGKLAYRVALSGKDGLEVDLGIATSKNRILSKDVLPIVRKALEERYPARKGMVSDRDVVDWRHGSMISYKAEKRP